MADVKEILKGCDNVLGGHGPPKTIVQQLSEVADWLGDEMPDTYGEGAFLNTFEREVARMFGKPAAVFMPSGTMAQQIALRIWCDRAGRPTIAMHPTAHLEFAEHLGYQYLHNLKRIQFGGPEFLAERMLTVEDFESLGAKPGAILIELPYRPLGGRMPAWDDLVATSEWARTEGIAMHLDGARAWHCAHYYNRSFEALGALFDSIYVSFYKDLGGLGGCMLIGPEDLIEESKIWQRRHGGNLVNQGALVASARRGVELNLPKVKAWATRAIEVGDILASIDGVRINPNPVQVNFFQLFLEGERTALVERHHELAQKTSVFLFSDLRNAAIPGFVTTELHCFDNALRFDLSKLRPFVEQLLLND